MTNREIFEQLIADLKAVHSDRGDLFKAAQEVGGMLGMEMQRMQVEQQQDIEAFISAKKADFEAHVTAAAAARALLAPKK